MEEFEVECVRSYRIVNGKRQFLVHWRGYNDESDTWEPEENLSNCSELVDEFWRNYKYEDEPTKLEGIATLLYNGEIVYFVNYGDTEAIVTKEYMSKHYPQDLMDFLST